MMGYLAYLGLRVGVGLVGMLPGNLIRRIGYRVGRLWASVDSGRRQMAARHFTRVTGSPLGAEQAAREIMGSYGRYYAEALWARASRVPGMIAATEVSGLEKIEGAREAGTGAIYALPHMGNWEAAAPISDNVGVPVVAVAEVLGNERITNWFTAMRAEYGIEIVLATGGIEVMRRLDEAIRENKAVALMSDRDLRGKGVKVEFFGEVTTMPPGPATLAIRTGAPLLPVGAYFTDDGYRLEIGDPIPVPDEGTKTEKVSAMTQTMAQHFERSIRKDPTQWHLVVPNWPSDKD